MGVLETVILVIGAAVCFCLTLVVDAIRDHAKSLQQELHDCAKQLEHTLDSIQISIHDLHPREYWEEQFRKECERRAMDWEQEEAVLMTIDEYNSSVSSNQWLDSTAVGQTVRSIYRDPTTGETKKRKVRLVEGNN